MTDFRSWGVPVTLGDRRVLHPGPLRWLRAVGWMVALFVVVAFASYGSMGLVQGLTGDFVGKPVAVGGLGAVISLLLYGLVVRFGENRRVDEIDAGAAPLGLLNGWIVGTLMFSAVMAIMFGFGLYEFRWVGPADAWRSVGLTLQSGVIEEVLMRAIVLRLMWRAFGPWMAFAFSAALFGALHMGNPNASGFAALCIAVEAGIMLGAFYALTGRIWVSIGVHGAWNFAQGYLFGAAVSGTDFGTGIAVSTARAGFSPYLTGGAFGPEASVPGLLVGTTVGVVVLWMAWRAGRFRRQS